MHNNYKFPDKNYQKIISYDFIDIKNRYPEPIERWEKAYNNGYRSVKYVSTFDMIPQQCLITPIRIESNEPIDYLFIDSNCELLHKIPLFFCDKLDKTTNNFNNKYTYNIPWNLLNQKELITCHANCTFTIISKEYAKAKIFLNHEYLTKPICCPYVAYAQNYISKQFNELTVTNINNDKIPLELKGNPSGIFIDNVDVSTVKSIEFFCDDQNFNYQKLFLEPHKSQVAKDCIYLSFNGKNYDYDDFMCESNKFESAQNGICLSKNDCNIVIDPTKKYNCSIKIDTTVEQNITVRWLTYNLIRYMSGYSASKYIICDKIN